MTGSDDPLSHALIQERAHHDACRAALTAMVAAAADQVVIGENAFASGADAEVLGRQLRDWAKELREEPHGPLFFGRLDFAPYHPTTPLTAAAGPTAGATVHAAAEAPAPPGDHEGQSYHIGRRRISEHPSAPPLVIDWRAPVSRAFYQAGAHDPQGVAVRRRFGWAPFSTGASTDLTGLEDEHLARGESGPGAIVAAEIERPRVGPMRDIAATIQPEQDDLVRSDLTHSLCVQGAPGTGKTAVGLHRAAYLLYTYPQRVQRAGLLILGPSHTFLSYIAEVLPALGERGIRQSTLDDEIARHPVRADDSPAAAVLKHDARMAGVLRRALYARVQPPTEPLTVPDGSYRWRVPLDELAQIVAEVRAEEPPYAVGRERVRTRAVRALRLRAERRSGPRTDVWARKVERAAAVTAFVGAVWPRISPEEVLAEFLTDPVDDSLTTGERAAVRWVAPPRSHRSARWTAADLVLLDELSGLIEHPQGFGHIVIDEAQDLSPMQCRAIARRAGFGSLTVLGDLAQGTTPWAARDWSEQLAHLGKEGTPVVPLTTGFRVPAAIVGLTNRLLGALDVRVAPARSLRTDGAVSIRRVGDLVPATVEAVREGLAREGSIGVIADEPDAHRLRTALEAAGIATAAPADTSGAAAGGAAAGGVRVTVLPATVAKGLEYDHVVVAEPAAIVAAEPRGPHRLYVVLTRAVSRLDVLHERPLPPELGEVPAGSVESVEWR